MSLRHYILTEDHKVVPADLYTWAHFFEEIDNRRVAQDVIGGWLISTVFIGLEDEIFETMIFATDDAGKTEWDGEDQWRYDTWDEAVAGHAHAVEIVRNAVELSHADQT